MVFFPFWSLDLCRYSTSVELCYIQVSHANSYKSTQSNPMKGPPMRDNSPQSDVLHNEENMKGPPMLEDSPVSPEYIEPYKQEKSERIKDDHSNEDNKEPIQIDSTPSSHHPTTHGETDDTINLTKHNEVSTSLTPYGQYSVYSSLSYPIFPVSYEELVTLKKRCYICGDEGIITCSQCESYIYCSNCCRDIHWPFHRATCSPQTNYDPYDSSFDGKASFPRYPSFISKILPNDSKKRIFSFVFDYCIDLKQRHGVHLFQEQKLYAKLLIWGFPF